VTRLKRVTITWYGGNRLVARGASGRPVLINFPPGESPAAIAAGGEPPAAEVDGRPPGPGEANAAPRAAGERAAAPPPPGPSPVELLLIATGACTALDVVSILRKKRVDFSAFEVEVTGKHSSDHPRFLTDVEVVYRLQAPEEALRALERAAQLSMEKYCGVSHSLRADKTWRCEIVPG